ncbi:MAG: hypothetical protein AAGE92_16060 [Cyanobacteria bacterium P01_G01_bin.4]
MPQISLSDGVKDFWDRDFIASGRHQTEVDFAIDEQILATL